MPDETITEDERGTAARAIKFLVAGYFVLLIGIAGALLAVRAEANHRSAGDRDILIARTVATCNERNITREAIRGTIDAAIEEGGVEDLTKVPGFDDLDPATQQYFRNIVDLQVDDTGATSTDRLIAYRDSLIDENCDELGERLRAELEKEA